MNSNRDKKSFLGFWSHHQLFFLTKLKFLLCVITCNCQEIIQRAPLYICIFCPVFPSGNIFAKLQYYIKIRTLQTPLMYRFPVLIILICVCASLVIQHSLHCCYLVVKSCQLFCNPMDCSPPDSSVHGISQARILEWVAISSYRRSSQLRDQTLVSCTGRQILYH